MRDLIKQPHHYMIQDVWVGYSCWKTVEVRHLIEAILRNSDLDPAEAYHYATVLKYALRAPKKGTWEMDLLKAQEHLGFLLEVVQRLERIREDAETENEAKAVLRETSEGREE